MTPSTSANPRRVPVARSSAPHGLNIATNILLRKGATFHSPTSPSSSSQSSAFSPPSFTRSQSNLDDVLDAHRRRAALELDLIDKALASIHLSGENAPVSTKSAPESAALASVTASTTNAAAALTLSKANLDSVSSASAPSHGQRRMLQPRSVNNRGSRHRHESDSGIGSSIASTRSKTAAKPVALPSPVQATALTRSATSSSGNEAKVGLSPRATNRIYEHTVKPLLAESDYKVFHPLLLECTTKINKKDIVCLRDVEKTILLLAPERTKEALLYLRFCLDSVNCLQATVDYLSEREQTRPSDAPYTTGYFIDLVDQIRQYAQQLADAKEKETRGVSNDTELNITDPIKIHGGIAVNGRPMELVRISPDGRAVSIATGLPVELEEDAKDAIRIKRSASQELMDQEEINRSMARRKKNAPPEEYAPKMCSVDGCKKMFKRPCDLTKHEKTHSRPWKCPIPSCKYHEYGWPTEKEKDRHLNDKHSDNPPMYECLFKPCTYKSKRDSNRKQHMEKTHGWKYVRTKTNSSGKVPGKKDELTLDDGIMTARASSSAGDLDSTANTTPPLVNMPTPASAQSPAVETPPLDDFNTPLYPHNMASYEFPTCTLSDVLATDIDIPAEIDELDFSPLDHNSPLTVSSLDNNSAYQDLGGADTTMFDDIYSAPVHLPTPDPNMLYGNNKNLLDQFMAVSDLCAPLVTPEQQQQLLRLQQMHHQMQSQEQMQKGNFPSHFSPLGEGNMMLFTPDSQVDMYEEDYAHKGDFILFPQGEFAHAGPKQDVPVLLGNGQNGNAIHAGANMFDDITPSLAAGYSQPNSQQIFMDWA